MTDRKPTDCLAALSIRGEHFWCDWPTDARGRHDGWAHANKEAQAVWSSPVATTLPDAAFVPVPGSPR
jgi:hypothetical protein